MYAMAYRIPGIGVIYTAGIHRKAGGSISAGEGEKRLREVLRFIGSIYAATLYIYGIGKIQTVGFQKGKRAGPLAAGEGK